MQPSQISADLSQSLVVAHDAGGANHLAAWIGAMSPEARPEIVATGPAATILRPLVREVLDRSQLDGAVLRHWTVISGTGWMSDLEHEARRLAARYGRRSIAVLDHWTNYASRFTRGDLQILPDEIWVVDVWAERLAQQCFHAQSVRVRRTTNSYLTRMQHEIGPLTADSQSVVFVDEPIRKSRLSEDHCLLNAAGIMRSAMRELGVPRDSLILIQPHPSRRLAEHDRIARPFGLSGRISRFSLTEVLRKARWVFGLESYALVIAAEAGRVAVSCLPLECGIVSIPDPRVTRASESRR